jgi:PAS domain S-box-containing protein
MDKEQKSDVIYRVDARERNVLDKPILLLLAAWTLAIGGMFLWSLLALRQDATGSGSTKMSQQAVLVLVAGDVTIWLLGVIGIGMRASYMKKNKQRLAGVNTERLVESHRHRLRQIFEALPNPAFYMDAAGMYKGCNQAFLEMFGLTREEIVDNTALEIFGDADNAWACCRADIAMLEQGGSRCHETTVVAHDGSKRDVILNTAIYTDDEKPAGLVGVIMDVTEQKEVKHHIERAKREWEHTFDSVTDIITLLDTDYHIVRANKALANAVGVPIEQLVGKHCYEILHHRDSPPEFCPMKRLLADGQAHDSEFHDDQSGRDFWATVTPVKGPDGCLQRVIHIIRDITSRKQVQRDLQKTIKELEYFNRLSIGREMRMIELKREVNDMAALAQEEPPYDLAFQEKQNEPDQKKAS